MASWTEERIGKLSNQQIEALRENAAKLGRQEIVALCDDELMHRKPVRAKGIPDGASEDHSGQYVSEFHFVCPSELGVIRKGIIALTPL